MTKKGEAVEAYLEGLAPDRKIPLDKLRELILGAVPDVRKTLQHGMPFFEYEDNRYAFASQKHYMSFCFADSQVLDKYKSRLGKLSFGKNCIRFKRLEQLPLRAVKNMILESI